MVSDNEFPVPSFREREAISHYLKIEHEFMPHKVFYTQTCNAQHRRHAVSTIGKLTLGRAIDTYVPYIAMNYFDRFVSTNSLSELQGSSLVDKASLVAMCCYTLSAKMRTTHFTQRRFLMRGEASFNPEKIMKMEFRILSGLQWRMRSITPFHFLDYYYPTFKRIGGFKRQSINEIIVQSQGEIYFTQFKPSEIAMSALLAATYLGYSSKFTLIEESIRISRELMGCYLEMVHLCRKRSIEIRNKSGDVIFSTVVAVPPSLVEASGSQTRAAKSEERLGKAVELQVEKHSTSTQFRNTVLDNDDEEEEEGENVAPLVCRRRRNRREEAVEAPKEVAEVETEAKKLGEEKEKAETVAGISEEKEVEAGTGAREDKCEGSDEIVEAETRARDDNGEVTSEEIVQVGSGTRDDKCEGPSEEIVEVESRAREDKGKAVDEICEVEEKSENELRRRQRKGKAEMEIREVEEENENELQRRQRKGKRTLEIRELEEENENELRRRQKGKSVQEIREVGEENENKLRRRQKGKAVQEISEVEEENKYGLLRRRRTEEVERARRAIRTSEIGPVEEIEPLKAMNFKLRWPITVRPGEILDYIDVSLQTDESRVTSTRCPTTIRGTGNDPPLVSNRCQCTII